MLLIFKAELTGDFVDGMIKDSFFRFIYQFRLYVIQCCASRFLLDKVSEVIRRKM